MTMIQPENIELMVDVVKAKETGAMYAVPHGDELSKSEFYVVLAENIPISAAIARYNQLGRRLNPKQRC